MKVKDLLVVLSRIDRDFEVYLSSDSEGNSYSTTDINSTVEVNRDGRYVALFPYEEGLDYEDLYRQPMGILKPKGL